MAWMFIPQIDPEAIWNRIWSGIWTLKCEKWQKKRGNCHGTSHRNWDWRSGKFDDHQKGAGANNYHYIYIYISSRNHPKNLSTNPLHKTSSPLLMVKWNIDAELFLWYWHWINPHFMDMLKMIAKSTTKRMVFHFQNHGMFTINWCVGFRVAIHRMLPSGKRIHNYGKPPFYSWVNQL